MIWMYGLAFGRGLTANVMKSRLLQYLAPLSYPVYLLHIPIARYYWLLTRGFEAKHWWDLVGGYPIPVEFYEVLAILGTSTLLGYFLDRYVLLHVTPYTVKTGMIVTQMLSDCFGTSSKKSSVYLSTFDQVKYVVHALSGVEVVHSSRLDSLGLDSLGHTAFLGTLRAFVPNAKQLTLQELATLDTVGDLVYFLSGDVEASREAYHQN